MKALLLFFISLFFANVSLADKNTIHICNDGNEWPPYFYYERINSQINENKVVGASIEILDKIFEYIDMKYSLTAV